MLGGDIKHDMIIPECLRRVMAPEENAVFDKLRCPVCECRGAVYGFARSGRDFIVGFASRPIVKRWLAVREAPALQCRCGTTGMVLVRLSVQEKPEGYVVAEERAGRKRACESGRDILGQNRGVTSGGQNSRIGYVCTDSCEVSLRQELEMCDHDHLH